MHDSYTIHSTFFQVFPASATAGNVTIPDADVIYQFQVTATILTAGVLNEGDRSDISPESTVFVPVIGMPN